MIRKLLWLVILVLIAACTIYISNGGIIDIVNTATPTECLACTQTPTDTVIVTATSEGSVTETLEPTLESTSVEAVTETAEISATPTTTATLIPPTATPTNTATAIPPTVTPIPTSTATVTTVPMTFAVQSTTPVFMVNFVHTTEACKWQGVAGQVFDKSGNPLKNYVVKITGTYNGASVSLLGITGMVSGDPYGPGSYEIVLGTTAVDSVDLLSIQVFNAVGTAITDPLKFSTSSDCSKNLIVINFKGK